MALISVIVPAYKMEMYLRACVGSVLAQTVSDLECILVDDGSADASGGLCDEYAARDPRVCVIHQANGGLSASRNAGIAAAKGAYFSFIDADDVVHPRFLEILLQTIREEKADIALCGYQRFQDGAPIPSGHISARRRCMTRKEAILALTRIGEGAEGEQMVLTCNKLFARRLFDTVRYPVGKWHEDAFVILPLLMQCGNVAKCEAELYFYRRRESSITGKALWTDRRHFDVLDALRQRCEMLDTPEYRDIYSAVVSHYFDWILFQIYEVAVPSGMYRQMRSRFLREMIKYGRWVRGRRFLVFAVCPRAYEIKHRL